MDRTLFRIGGLSITVRELLLALAIGMMGFVFSMRSWLIWLDTLTPFTGMLVYYAILYGSLYILSLLGLTVFGIKMTNPIQLFGLILITFAFFITTNWTSPYINIIAKGSAEGISNIFYMSEDGSVWYLVGLWFPKISFEIHRVITYIVAPFIISLFGGFLASGRIKL